VRILAHDLAILAGSWLRLVSIDDEEGRAAVSVLGHEGPLEARGEASSATATEARVLDVLNDCCCLFVVCCCGFVKGKRKKRERERERE
jgi:hypothetical protein